MVQVAGEPTSENVAGPPPPTVTVIVQLELPAVTGIVNDPEDPPVGVPLAFNTIVWVPVAEKVPEALNVIPSTVEVTIE